MTTAQAREVAYWLRQRDEAAEELYRLATVIERVLDDPDGEEDALGPLLNVDFAVRMGIA